MKIIYQQFDNIIKEELFTINNKIRATGYLEILKYKLLDKIPNIIENIEIKDKENLEYKFVQENDERILRIKLFFNKLPKISLNNNLENNLLLICLNENVKIDIEDSLSKKYETINLISNTGITLSKGTNYNLNFLKNSIILEIEEKDKKINIENLNKNTI